MTVPPTALVEMTVPHTALVEMTGSHTTLVEMTALVFAGVLFSGGDQ